MSSIHRSLVFDLQVCCCRAFLWLLLLGTGKSLFVKSNCSPLMRFHGHRHVMSSLHEAAMCTNYTVWVKLCCSITRDNLGPYKVKVLVIPTVYLVTTMVSLDLRLAIDLQHCLRLSCNDCHQSVMHDIFACRFLTSSQTAHILMMRMQISLKALTW